MGATNSAEDTDDEIKRPIRQLVHIRRIAFAIEAFDSQGNYTNSGDAPFRSIGAYMASDDALPLPSKKD